MADPTRSEILKALRLSIAKWKKLSEGRGVDRGSRNCALCRLCYREGNCGVCPVKDYSGHGICVGTPYDMWLDGDIPGAISIKPDTPRRLRWAKAEYRYLLRVRAYFKNPA